VRDDGRSLRGLIATAALLVACGDPAPRGPGLQVVGESTKIRRGDPLPASSPFFDGAVVRVRAARGEILGLQVLRAAPGSVPVSLTVDGAVVQAFAVDHLPVVRPSTSMYGPSRGAGQYPDRLRPIAADGDGAVPTERAAYFDLAIAADAAPGLRRGELRVGAVAYPVELEVVPLVLPPVAAAPRVWAYYDPREVARDEGAEPGTDAAWAIEQRWAALFRAHGVYASPELHVDDFDRRLPLAAGSEVVPVIFPADQEALREAVAFYADRLRGTGQRAFAIPIDEPRKPEQKRAVAELAAQVRAAGGGREVLYAVTDTPHAVYGDLVDIYISPYAIRRDRPDGGPPLWTYNGSPPAAGSMILDAPGTDLRTWGWIAHRWRVPLWYVWDALYWHDRYSARRKKLQRIQIPLSPVDRDAVTFDDGTDHGNLDGVLAFPGLVPSLRLKALRRGQQDRLLLEAAARCNPAAVAALTARLVPTALADAGKPPAAGSWPTDEAPWELARRELLTMCP
jgi:hypothetical protein